MVVTLTKFHDVSRKVADFALVANFKECPILEWVDLLTHITNLERVWLKDEQAHVKIEIFI